MLDTNARAQHGMLMMILQRFNSITQCRLGLVLAATLLILPSCGGGGGGGGTDLLPIAANKSLSIRENQFVVGSILAPGSDGERYNFSLTGGDDAALFTISASGILSFVEAPDFENPLDGDADNIYEVSVQVQRGKASTTEAFYVEVLDVDEAPLFQSETEDAFDENTSGVVHVLNAVDPEGQSVQYRIRSVQGPNAGVFDGFSIDASTGEISLATPLDYEAEAAGGVYVTRVEASDGVNAAGHVVYLELLDIPGKTTAGARIDGVFQYEAATYQLGRAGDTDGDGFSDLLITSLHNSVYLLFGDEAIASIETPGGVSIPLAEPAVGERITFINSSCEDCPATISTSDTDIDGDGLKDVVIAYPNFPDANSGSGVGRVYIVFGAEINAARENGDVEIDLGMPGRASITLVGDGGRLGFGRSIASGDIDGDGFSDVAIGSPFNADAAAEQFRGIILVAYGSELRNMGRDPIKEGDLPQGSNVVVTREPSRGFGSSVAVLPDVDGDSSGEIATGAPNANEIILVSGSELQVARLSGTNIVVDSPSQLGVGFLKGASGQGNQSLGRSLASVPDIDGDGSSDLMIGGQSFNQDFPGAFLVYSGTLRSSMLVEAGVPLNAMTSQQGVKIFNTEINENLLNEDFYVGGGANIDGNSVADLLIGSPTSNLLGRKGGGAWVLFGEAIRINSPADIDLSTLSGSQGLALAGVDTSDSCGRSLTGLGDLDGDGLEEVAIGSSGSANSLQRAGEGYLLSGKMLRDLPKENNTVIDLQPLFGLE